MGNSFNNYLKPIKEEYDDAKKEKYGIDLEYLDIVKPRDIKFYSHDNTCLNGKLIENSQKDFVILYHGYKASLENMIPYAKMFTDMGYSVLMVDSRCHGLSGGKYCTFGLIESDDLIKWIDHLVFVYGSDITVGLCGVSMGSSVVNIASSKDIKPNVKFAVSDCGFSVLYDQMVHLTANNPKKKKSVFFSKLIVRIGFIKVALTTGVNLFKVKPSKYIKDSKVPTLFIHGAKDSYVPVSCLTELYNNHPGIKDKWIVEEGHHSNCIMTDPVGYYQHVLEFINSLNITNKEEDMK